MKKTKASDQIQLTRADAALVTRILLAMYDMSVETVSNKKVSDARGRLFVLDRSDYHAGRDVLRRLECEAGEVSR